MLQDELAVAGIVAIELEARLVCDQWLEQLFAPDKREARDVPAGEMQKIEGVIDEMHAALAVGRRLGVGEARQSGFVDAAEFAVEIGGLHVQVRERRDGAWIFGRPVEAGSGQELHAAIVDARGHAIAVELDFVDPLRAGRRLLDRLGKLGRDELRKGSISLRPAGFDGL